MSHNHSETGSENDSDSLVEEEEECESADNHAEQKDEEEDEDEDSNYALCRYCDDEANLMAACHLCGENEYCMTCNPECMTCGNHICVQCLRFETGGGFCADCHEDDGYYCQDCVVIYFDDDKRCCKRHAFSDDKNEV